LSKESGELLKDGNWRLLKNKPTNRETEEQINRETEKVVQPVLQ